MSLKLKYFVLITLLMGVFTGMIRADIPAQERAALIAFYNSTNGDNWGARSNSWKTPPLYTDGFGMPGTENNWAGITVENDHVTGIQFINTTYGYYMDGSLPPELGDLPNLKCLSISYYCHLFPGARGGLKGNIPSNLGKLGNLETFELYGYQFSGSIPAELGNLSNLKTLDLHYNLLTGTIPPGLGNLSGLQTLNLQDNQFTGSIPPELGNLGNLQNLFLSDNLLTGSIPPNLGNLVNLQNLFLTDTQVSGNIPNSIGNLAHLEILGLGDTQISGNIPYSIGNLTGLQFLFLDNTHLTGGIPDSFGNLVNLEEIYICNTQLNGSFPSSFGNLRNLRILHMFNNRMTGSIPSEFGNLSKLYDLRLQKNQLSGNIPPGIWKLRNLQVVLLNDNQLTGSIPPEFGGLDYIDAISLSNNYLSGPIPPGICTLTCIGELALDHNYLTGEIPSCLTGLNCLRGIDIGNNCLYTSDDSLKGWLFEYNPSWEEEQDRCDGKYCTIILNRASLYFCAIRSGAVTGAQTVYIGYNGSGSLNWNAGTDVSWLSVSPAAGSFKGIITVSVNPSGLALGTYTGNISITDPNATNSPQSVLVTLKVKSEEEKLPPFGEFSTPLDGAAVFSSVPITGWVLDELGVQSVKIYRIQGQANIYIGDATFVEGARPDIELAYPDYPNNTKAGWGYMLLTNFLPNGGNGGYTFNAVATDLQNKSVVLGAKTITIDNAHAVKPFGYIDSPVEGGTASGENFVNYGWVLTPQPNHIDIDGSTIDVWLDGIAIGHPVYNNYRSDIATLFPGYANCVGAVGYFYLDTTAYRNGVHTISWTAADSAGNTDGIGSRYFTVMNEVGSDKAEYPGIQSSAFDIDTAFLNDSYRDTGPVAIRGGYSLDKPVRCVYPDASGKINIEIKELERLEIYLSVENEISGPFMGYAKVGNRLRGLPIGSTFDGRRGVFSWQPGPGFVGEYHFVFMEKEEMTGYIMQKEVIVRILPYRGLKERWDDE
ncbi:MAG: hypothetical protein NT166_31390 [Candidatus Aminicenantes bacterium]|nr:hypothetical protein [Candidatus Aminicenantes bacterium]